MKMEFLNIIPWLAFQHIVEHRADTLLPQYLGMYRLTVNDNETYMIVTRNAFSPRIVIHKKYDLKVGARNRISRKIHRKCIHYVHRR